MSAPQPSPNSSRPPDLVRVQTQEVSSFEASYTSDKNLVLPEPLQGWATCDTNTPRAFNVQ